MIAYNMGPGATDKWLASGADPRRLPKETQGYISGVNLAKGGEVKHYYTGDYVGFGEEIPYDESQSFGLKDWWNRNTPGSKEFVQAEKKAQKKLVSPTKAPTISNAPTTSTGLTPEEMMAGSTRAGTWEALANDQTTGRAIPTAAEAPKSRLDAWMDKMIEREGKIEKQREMDKHMALLTAGLGMLGGTSQYALENIGKGALAGVQQYGESNKQRAAEQSALDKSMLYANRYQGAEDIAKQNALYNRSMKQQQYNLDVQKHGTEQQKIAINQYETHINNAMKSLDKNPLLTADPAARAAAEDRILNGETARRLYRRAYGEDPTGGAKGTTIRFDANGRQIAG